MNRLLMWMGTWIILYYLLTIIAGHIPVETVIILAMMAGFSVTTLDDVMCSKGVYKSESFDLANSVARTLSQAVDSDA